MQQNTESETKKPVSFAKRDEIPPTFFGRMCFVKTDKAPMPLNSFGFMSCPVTQHEFKSHNPNGLDAKYEWLGPVLHTLPPTKQFHIV